MTCEVARKAAGRAYLNTRAPSRRPKEMKSLLDLWLSPRHINRPSLAVVLNLMNTFDLEPDTLEETHNCPHLTVVHSIRF